MTRYTYFCNFDRIDLFLLDCIIRISLLIAAGLTHNTHALLYHQR